VPKADSPRPSPLTPAGPGPTTNDRRTLLLLSATLGLASAQAATIGAVASELRHAFGVNNTAVGVLASVTTAAAALATLPFGVMVDRTRRTRLLAVCVVLWGVATAMSSLAGSFAFLFATRLALGALTGAAGPGVASLLGDTFPESRRGRSYGLVLAGELVGAGLGFGLAGELAAVSWRLSFAVLAPPAWVLCVYLWRMQEPLRGQTVGSTEGEAVHDDVVASWRELSLRRTIVYVLSVPTNVVFIFSGAFAYFFYAGLRTFGVELIGDQYHVSQAAATLIFLLVGLGGLAGVLSSGPIGDRLEGRYRAGRVLIAMVALCAAAAAFAPALLLHSYLLAVPLITAGAFGLGASNPPLSAGRLQVIPPGLWGRAESVQGVLRQIGDTLGPFSFGFAADHLAGGGRAGLQSSFLVMLSALVLAAGILALALRTYPRDSEAARFAAAHGPAAPRS
jgi:predicted MFS family arabinose efflux permease